MERFQISIVEALVFLLSCISALYTLWCCGKIAQSYWVRKKWYLIVWHIAAWCIALVVLFTSNVDWGLIPFGPESYVFPVRTLFWGLSYFAITCVTIFAGIYVFDARTCQWRDSSMSALFISSLLLIQTTWYGGLIYLGILPLPALGS